MGTIITAATIMAMYLNSTVILKWQYCYNSDVEKGKVLSIYLYDTLVYSLCVKLDYRYEYDS